MNNRPLECELYEYFETVVASAVESNQSMNAVEHKQAAATPKCKLMEVNMVNTGKSTAVPDKLGNLLCENLSAMSRQKEGELL